MKQGRGKDSHSGGKREPISHKGNPEGVAQLGMATAFKKEPITEGKGYKGASPRPAASGPGGGRTIHRSGSQGRHS